MKRSFLTQKIVQFSLKAAQCIHENGIWLTLPETVKHGFLFFQNHLRSNPHGCSIHVPPQRVSRVSREPVRQHTITWWFWTIFQTNPLVGAFADIPGTLYARKCRHGPHGAQPWCPGRGLPSRCSWGSRLSLGHWHLGDRSMVPLGCCHLQDIATLSAMPRAEAE